MLMAEELDDLPKSFTHSIVFFVVNIIFTYQHAGASWLQEAVTSTGSSKITMVVSSRKPKRINRTGT